MSNLLNYNYKHSEILRLSTICAIYILYIYYTYIYIRYDIVYFLLRGIFWNSFFLYGFCSSRMDIDKDDVKLENEDTEIDQGHKSINSLYNN